MMLSLGHIVEMKLLFLALKDLRQVSNFYTWRTSKRGLIEASTEMVPDLIEVPDFFGP